MSFSIIRLYFKKDINRNNNNKSVEMMNNSRPYVESDNFEPFRARTCQSGVWESCGEIVKNCGIFHCGKCVQVFHSDNPHCVQTVFHMPVSCAQDVHMYRRCPIFSCLQLLR